MWLLSRGSLGWSRFQPLSSRAKLTVKLEVRIAYVNRSLEYRSHTVF